MYVFNFTEKIKKKNEYPGQISQYLFNVIYLKNDKTVVFNKLFVFISNLLFSYIFIVFSLFSIRFSSQYDIRYDEIK